MAENQTPANPMFATDKKADMNVFNEASRRRVAIHLSRIGKVLSGELDGKGRSIQKLDINNGNPCATDGNTVWLSYPILPDVQTAAENLVISEAILAHEAAGHLRYTNFNAWKRIADAIKRGDDDRLLHDFVNIVEDARVNWLLGQDFAGSKKRLDYTQSRLMAQHKATLEGRVIGDNEAPKLGVIAIATEVILAIPHFVNHPQVNAMMDEARPLFADAIASQDTSTVIKKARVILEIYRTHFPADETNGSEYGASSSPEGEALFADDMSMDKITEAANNQRKMKKEAEKVRTKRFKKMERPTEGRDMSDAPDNNSDDEAANAVNDALNGADGQGSEMEGDESSDCNGGEGSDGEGECESGSQTGDSSSADGQGDEVFGESGDESVGQGESQDASNVEGEVITAPAETGESGSYGVGNALAKTGEGTADVQMMSEMQDILDELGDMIDYEVEYIEENGDMFQDDSGVDGGGRFYGHDVVVGKKHDESTDFSMRTDGYAVVERTNRAGIKRIGKVMKNLVKGADTRFNSHKKRGRLDTRRLWAHSTSDKVFKTDKISPEFKANVVVLIDASGSMGCTVPSEDSRYKSRADCAAEAAITISSTLEDIGATYEVVDFFSQYGRGSRTQAPNGETRITQRKRFDETLNSKTKAAIAKSHVGRENADGFALRWAIDRTAHFGNEGAKRIVFVISDGSPAGPAPPHHSSRSHLVSVLKEAEDEDVIIFSVGIAGMDTSRYYGNHGHASVSNTANLAQDILLPLKACLKKALRA